MPEYPPVKTVAVYAIDNSNGSKTECGTQNKKAKWPPFAIMGKRIPEDRRYSYSHFSVSLTFAKQRNEKRENLI